MIQSFNELDEVRAQCRALVHRRALASGAVTVVPVPLVDAAADVTILLRLLPRISTAYGLSPEQVAALDPERRTVVYSAIRGVGESFVARAITRRMIAGALTRIGAVVGVKSTARFAPVAGQALAAGLSYGAMRWIGNAHIEDCHRVAHSTLDRRMFGVEGGVVIEGVATRV